VLDSIRVLYVEDDERLARPTVESLELEGHEVHVVPRGDLAVADVARIRPDVVVLDLSCAGVDVCRQLRARYAAPIIMVTERAGDHGADAYLEKPLQPGELLARIRTHARRRKIATLPPV